MASTSCNNKGNIFTEYRYRWPKIMVVHWSQIRDCDCCEKNDRNNFLLMRFVIFIEWIFSHLIISLALKPASFIATVNSHQRYWNSSTKNFIKIASAKTPMDFQTDLIEILTSWRGILPSYSASALWPESRLIRCKRRWGKTRRWQKLLPFPSDRSEAVMASTEWT